MRHLHRHLLPLLCSLLCGAGAAPVMAQNLVPNGNFEIYTSCPINQSEIHKCPPWQNPPNTLGTVDYYHSCSPFSISGVPINIAGHQHALNGEAYAGGGAYVNPTSNGREYLMTELNCPLTAGVDYTAGFHINRSNISRYAIDRMGMYIGDTIHGNGITLLGMYVPQVQSTPGIFLEDTVNWMEISGTFTAIGGERYIALGNFFANDSTAVKDSVGPMNSNGAQYYIDSVYLYPVNDLPTVTISNDTIICTGGSALLEGSGSGVYHWFRQGFPLDTLGREAMLTVSPDTTTVYELQTCMELLRVTVQVVPAPAVNLGSDTLLCAGQQLVLTAPPGMTSNLWQDGSSDNTFTVTQAGTYHVEAANQCGTDTDTVEVLYLSPPSINLGSDTLLCPSETLLLSAATESATHLWQDGSTESFFTVTETGTYHVEVQNQCGSDTDTVTVTYISPPSIDLGSDTLLCDGQTITLTAMADSASYQWQDGSSDNTFTVTQAGIYHVEAANQCGTDTDTVEVLYLSPPSIGLGSNALLCPGETLLLSAATDSATYLWQDGSIESFFTVTQAGTYHVEVQNQCGADTDTVTVSYISPPSVDLGPDTLLCNGQTLTLTASADSAAYLWQDGSTENTFTVTEAGTYHVEADNQCGTASDTVTVSFMSPPSLTLGPDTLLCDGQTLLLTASADSATYLWQDGSAENTFTVTEAGTYHVTATNLCGTASDTVTVTYISPPSVDLGPDTLLCDGQTIILTASGDSASYQWQDGSTENTFNVTQAGTYHVEVTNQCGTATDTVEVLYLSPPSIGLGSDTLLCPNETLFLTVTADSATYLWQDGSTESFFTVMETGVYHVEVQNQCGADTDTIIVNYISLPSVDLGPDTIICMGDTLILVVLGEGLLFQWQDGSGGATFSVTEEGVFWAIAPHPCGMVGDTVHIALLDCDTLPKPLEMPNIITPNGDGHNDALVFDNLPPGSSLTIYSRWGRRILATENYLNDWDAQGVTDGTYFYVLTLPSGEAVKGYVTVVR